MTRTACAVATVLIAAFLALTSQAHHAAPADGAPSDRAPVAAAFR